MTKVSAATATKNALGNASRSEGKSVQLAHGIGAEGKASSNGKDGNNGKVAEGLEVTILRSGAAEARDARASLKFDLSKHKRDVQ